jgi:hypothetical protein
MENHYHTILRTRPDIVARWSDHEVATRWLTLFPQHRNLHGTPTPPTEQEIRALMDGAKTLYRKSAKHDARNNSALGLLLEYLVHRILRASAQTPLPTVVTGLVVGSPLAGILSDRLGTRTLILLCGSVMSVVSFILFLAN